MHSDFFKKYPEFIELDNRKDRQQGTICAANVSAKLLAILPPEQIKNKRVLDLGCCIGTMGQWCLEHGVSYYVGVDIQHEYISIADSLFRKYWSDNQYKFVESDFVSFLKSTSEQFDIVICLGILFVNPNVFEVIDMITALSADEIIIDINRTHGFYGNNPIIELSKWRKMITPSSTTSAVPGISANVTEAALRIIFEMNGYSSGRRICYTPPDEIHDFYFDIISTDIKNSHICSTRQIFKFLKTDYKINSISSNIAEGTELSPLSTHYPVLTRGSWVFDSNVANRFRQEALDNIPGYVNVQNFTLNKVKEKCDIESNILDIGCAVGETLTLLIENGYKNAFGTESSLDMLNKNKFLEHVIHTDSVPHHPNGWDVIIANWTLHFIHPSKRHDFIKKIFDALNDGGTFILTEKVESDLHADLVRFKQDRGLSMEQIKNKANAIKGVLIPQRLDWYLDTLKVSGFKNIKVEKTHIMFVTISCEK